MKLLAAVLITVLLAIAVAPHAPLHASPLAAPSDCNGQPWMTGGVDGCGPITIGRDVETGSVEIRMNSGETFSVWQGGEWSLYMDGSAASAMAAFRGDVKAQVFLAAQPVLRTADFTVGDGENTILVDPNGSTIVAHLPVATYHRGRRITIKAVGNGRVDIQPALNPMSNIVDTIDGIYSAMLYGAQTGKMAAITVEAFDFDSDDNQSTPEPTGWVIVGGY